MVAVCHSFCIYFSLYNRYIHSSFIRWGPSPYLHNFLIRRFFSLLAGFKKQLEPLGVVTSTISHLNTLTTTALNMEPTTQVPIISRTVIFCSIFKSLSSFPSWIGAGNTKKQRIQSRPKN